MAKVYVGGWHSLLSSNKFGASDKGQPIGEHH